MKAATLSDAAAEYRQRFGLSVIPVGRDKLPLIKWAAYQSEPAHADQLDEWWTRWPDANVGVVTGAVSGLVVLDADGPPGLAGLKAVAPEVVTWLSRTGRLEGGWQQFFRHPGDSVIGNRAGLRPGLDVRGDGGYVIVPPSRHASGRYYEWLAGPGDVELTPLPASLLALLVTPAANGNGSAHVAGEIPAGQRNDTLYRLSRSLGTKGLSREAIAAALLEENRARCRPPLSEQEVRAIAQHAATQPARADFRRDAHPEALNGVASDDLDLVSVGQLLDEPDTAPAWLVEKRLPAAGLGLLASKPKGGKSTLARVLAVCVARGTEWLGHPTMRGAVVYLALEEKRQEIREHFRALGATSADPIYILCATAPQDALARLRREADRRRPALIIVDTLFKLIRVEDGNDYVIVTAALEPLLTLARETGAHVLAVHHLGKGLHDAGDAILGSTAIFAAVDTVLLLRRTERYRTLSSIQRYGEDLEEITLTLDPLTREVSAGVPRAEADMAEASRLILDVIARATAPMTEAALDDAIEFRRQIWKRALRDLVGAGKVVRTGRGGKADPFRYCGSLSIAGNQGTRTLFPDLSAEPQREDSGSQVPCRVVVPTVPATEAI